MAFEDYSLTRLDAAAAVRDAAWEAVRAGGHLDAVMAGLRRVLPYDEALLSRWDPYAQEHIHLAGSMSPSASEFLRYELHRDPLFGYVRRTGQTQWLSNLTCEQRSGSATVRRVVEPAGYAEGLTQCLYSSEGRYIGVLNLGVRRVGSDLAESRRVFTLLFDSLAAAVESGYTPDSAVPRSWSVFVPDNAERSVETHPRTGLVANLAVADVVRAAMRTRRLPTTLVIPFGDTCTEIEIERVEHGTRARCRVVDSDNTLTWREMQVLAEVARGRTNIEIAQRLLIAPRTVAAHLEHILVKLNVPNRAAAAAYAAALGFDLAPTAAPVRKR